MAYFNLFLYIADDIVGGNHGAVVGLVVGAESQKHGTVPVEIAGRVVIVLGKLISEGLWIVTHCVVILDIRTTETTVKGIIGRSMCQLIVIRLVGCVPILNSH